MNCDCRSRAITGSIFTRASDVGIATFSTAFGPRKSGMVN
jgi:hypothetical protein